MSQFVDGGITLHTPDRDTQDNMQTAHDDGYVAATAFCTIEQTHTHMHTHTHVNAEVRGGWNMTCW